MNAGDIAGLERALGGISLTTQIPHFHEADILHNPLDVCRSYLAELLCNLVGCEPDLAYRSIQWPNNIFNGDLTVTLPKLCPGVKPSELAPDLLKKFPNDHVLFLPPILDGVHLRIFLSQDVLPRLFIPYIVDRARNYGSLATRDDAPRKVLVEFSSPNIWEEFQGRHLRSTIVGACVSNLFESAGWIVKRINHLSDWGKNVALLKVGWDRFGNEDAYQADPMLHLLDVYHRIDDLFRPEVAASKHARDEAVKSGKDESEVQAELESQGIYAERNAASKKLEEGDEDAVAFWTRLREVNISVYTELYAQLGVTFDEHSGESQVSADSMAKVEQLLKAKGICQESAGASVIHMQDHGLRAGTAVLRDRAGAPMYLLRDLTTMIERAEKHEFDKMIVVAGNNNNSHFTQLHHILIALGMKELADKIQHLKFSDVSTMSEKLGKGYKPQAIIDECERSMIAVLDVDPEKAAIFRNPEPNARALGISALIAHELITQPTSAHHFDTSAMTAFKPGTGTELQYWYTKVCLLLEKHKGKPILTDEDYQSLAEDDPVDLLRVLIQFPEVAHATHTSLKPSAIIAYLTSVVEQLEACLSNDDGEDSGVEGDEATMETAPGKEAAEHAELTPGQVALFESARIVLHNGLQLLGITPYATTSHQRADTPTAE
ncbi:Nucleotidylyl transferase [Bimuria novae-zelandiae CBS 107.79]|uniref:arginine--tRNA ligase n=1 Tax=Bimuria novae-zelandiae CBS 107.79 TaxID=1447943 RepID=A0A6A5V2P9_9PLEO|nr:Nucleotidylyl transferase [Bimuria novae-zelandiae CBS 107.79]